MPYPADHFLLAFGGPMFVSEEWSCSLRSTVDTQGTSTIAETLDSLTTVLSTWWATSPAGAQAKLAWVKYNRIGVDGKYVATSTTYVNDLDPVISPGTASPYTAQTAVVATLETGAARGLAHRGRMFLPLPTAAITVADGRMVDSAATGIATKVAELIASLNAVDGYGTTSVVSPTREGAIRTVTGVSVGRVLDTMRSRRVSIPEERPAAVPVGGT